MRTEEERRARHKSIYGTEPPRTRLNLGQVFDTLIREKIKSDYEDGRISRDVYDYYINLIEEIKTERLRKVV